MVSIKCIDNTEYITYLTIGKVYQYDPSDTMSSYIKAKVIKGALIAVKDDKGNKHYVPKKLFTTIQEVRDNQLKKLGIK